MAPTPGGGSEPVHEEHVDGTVVRPGSAHDEMEPAQAVQILAEIERRARLVAAGLAADLEVGLIGIGAAHGTVPDVHRALTLLGPGRADSEVTSAIAVEVQSSREGGAILVSVVLSSQGRGFDEVLRHLPRQPGLKVKLTLDIQVQVPEGVPEDVQRTVSENCGSRSSRVRGFPEE